MQKIFDNLYERSKNNATKGLRLYEHIISKENILLAYRNIKANTGSKTAGTDGVTIDNYKIENVDSFIEEIRGTISNYEPQTVHRVEIPKPNGKKRPLGIPTMRDRLIQQMFKQVLEPICEAKFFEHSYGFRPNRSTHHAMGRCLFLMNFVKHHHVVDIDIQGFFDNVNHSKLLKQMFNIGIKDKRVLRIVSKMLKAPIEGMGIPTKGTPQGGILSPLLSNIVLNDLDWWVTNQWGGMKTQYQYKRNDFKLGSLKKTNLKEMYIVRYADDFKVFTNNHKSAIKIFHAIKGYLKNQLKLDISNEKSTITNLRRRKSDFLGFSMKLIKKNNRFIANTHVCDKQVKRIQKQAKEKIKELQRNRNKKSAEKYNMFVLGIKNYYKIATHVNNDFSRIAYNLLRPLYNRLKRFSKYEKPKEPSKLYQRLHKGNMKTFKVGGVYLFPIADVQTKNPMNFSQTICNYTTEGRKELHKRLKPDISYEIYRMVRSTSLYNATLEYADNKISRYSMQQGKCAITGQFLTTEEVHCHHKLPREMGGTDKFDNLVIVHRDIHKLIHATTEKTIEKYMKIFQLDGKQLEKINKFRKVCNLVALV